MDLASRSSRQETSVSPGWQVAIALTKPGLSSRVPDNLSWYSFAHPGGPQRVLLEGERLVVGAHPHVADQSSHSHVSRDRFDERPYATS